jgi:hypothetical protein
VPRFFHDEGEMVVGVGEFIFNQKLRKKDREGTPKKKRLL